MRNFIKRSVLAFIVILLFMHTITTHAQQVVSDFEDLTLETDSEWHGADGSGGFANGTAVFVNNYDATYQSWIGFAYSNKVDMATQNWTNQYSVYNTGGYNGSSNFVIANVSAGAIVRAINKNDQILPKGFYITNTTFTALTMKNGDQFSKKFGGQDGNDRDSLVVTAKGYVNGVLTEDSVNFVLADYRFEDNSEDYIVDSWEWFDLSSLGYVDSLYFFMYSSDNGAWGINTPTYFAMDNFTVETLATSIKNNSQLSFNVYPNPAVNYLQLDLTSVIGNDIDVTISDLNGKKLIHTMENGGTRFLIELSALREGIYVVTIRQNDRISSLRLVKQ